MTSAVQAQPIVYSCLATALIAFVLLCLAQAEKSAPVPSPREDAICGVVVAADEISQLREPFIGKR